MTWRNAILVGDVRERLAELPDQSVQCVVTSPPYWGLRDYGTASWAGGDEDCDHKQGRDGAGRADGIVDDRSQRNRDGAAALTRAVCRCGATRIDAQVGLEPTPEAYVSGMVETFREVRRVLADDGTLWLNLGDSYSGIGKGSGGEYETSAKQNTNRGANYLHGAPRLVQFADGLKPKDLVGIPWRVAFALQADGWWLRSDIIWSKPNPMPESVTDRPTKAHEYVFLLSKSATYYYDHEAIKEPMSPVSMARISQPNFEKQTGGAKDYANGTNPNRSMRQTLVNFKRKTDKQRGHSRRHAGFNDRWDAMSHEEQAANGRNKRSVWEIATKPYAEAHFATYPPELVKPCILAGSREGDVVLDPFMGSGTTALVALKAGRDFVGIELNPTYAAMAERRIAPYRDRLL